MHIATKAVHGGQEPDPTTGALMTPIYMTSTFQQEAPGVTKGFDYTRANNPNFIVLEKALASLENARYATVFSSGLGVLTALLSTLNPADKVVAMEGLYGGTYRLFHRVFSRFGIHLISINQKNISDLEDILIKEKPKWLFWETPTNPLLEIFDIKALADLAKKHDVLSIVDNTFATPINQNPIDLNADIVWHSTTKYIGGHSDVVGGVAMTNSKEIKEKLDFARMALGVNPSPFDAWLITRGVKTLALRMERHNHNGMAFAEGLTKHPLVEKIYYPGLKNHPKYEIAKAQMRGFGGIVSVEFKLPVEKIKQMISSYQLFALAESLGGVESLVCHPATMTHASIPPEERKKIGLKDTLVRFSLGIEDIRDLIEEIHTGLES